jgi:hypothetical protein
MYITGYFNNLLICKLTLLICIYRRNSKAYGKVEFLDAIKLQIIEVLTFFVDAELVIYQSGIIQPHFIVFTHCM